MQIANATRNFDKTSYLQQDGVENENEQPTAETNTFGVPAFLRVNLPTTVPAAAPAATQDETRENHHHDQQHSHSYADDKPCHVFCHVFDKLK